MVALKVRQHLHDERSCRSGAAHPGRKAAADPRMSAQALGRAIGNRAMARLVARQTATDVPRVGPILNPADPRLRNIFESAGAGSSGSSSESRAHAPEPPQWLPRNVSRLLPIKMGEGTRRSPKLKEPEGPGEAKCRGACGVDCPHTCKNVGTYTEEYIEGDKGYLIEFPNAIMCGTHEGCRMHDACFDHAVRQGEREMGGPMHNGCNIQAAAKYGLQQTNSWRQGGGPYDAWWYFVDAPWIKSTWTVER
jgi:hypothetical protein